MQFSATITDVDYDLKTNKVKITLLTSDKKVLNKCKTIKDTEVLNVEIKKSRVKRSLDANAYCWLLLQKIAEVINGNKDDVYLDMLGKYGVFTHVVVKANVVSRVKEEWKLTKELGEVKVNGKAGIQLQCYFGSSTYDTKEMSVFIDGIVNECKDLGIETKPEADIEELKEEWGK